VLERATGLTGRSLAAIAELERQVVAADGGRLKLEWGTLRSRRDDQVQDLLWWAGERLLGFVGRYAFGAPAELAGMVAPEARRRGIGLALLTAATQLCRDNGDERALLVVPRGSAGGTALAGRFGGELVHSEHALELGGEPVAGPSDARIALRRAALADAGVVSRLLAAGFGRPVSAVAERLAIEDETTLLVERDGTVIGTLRVTRDGERAGVYGFVVDPAWRGRGVGRDVLRRVCRRLRDDGVRRIGLEVAVDNDRALGLYTSLGFRPVTTEDYYGLRLVGR
jgi:ribosomal protein S18 acetylase RimI-like enzyme